MDASGKRTQKALRRKLSSRTLKTSASQTDITVHAERMYQMWLLLNNNNPDDPSDLADFWEELTETMPPAPETSHVASVRSGSFH